MAPSKNLLAQQKFLADDKKRHSVYRKRAIKRIASGQSVSAATLDKYEIGDPEYNRIRAANGYSRVKVYRETTAKTEAVNAKINREQIIQKALEDEMAIAENVRTTQQQLNGFHNRLRADHGIPASTAKSKADVPILQSDAPITYDVLRGYLKSQIGTEKFSNATFEKYFGKTPNAGSMRRLLNLLGCDPDNIVKCFRNTKKVISTIDRMEVADATKQQYYSGIYVMFGKYPNKQLLTKAQMDKYDERFKDLRDKADIAYKDKQDTDTNDLFSTLRDKILKVFKFGTQEYLFIKLFEEQPLRDNLGDVLIFHGKKSVLKTQFITPGGKHYDDFDVLFWDIDTKSKTHGQMTLYIKTHKTRNKYGMLTHILSRNLTDEIEEDLRVKKREHLFIKNEIYQKLKPRSRVVDSKGLYAGGAMSSFITSMLKKAGIKAEANEHGGTNNGGGVNLLRHAWVTEWHKNNPNATAQQKQDLAKKMAHTPMTNLGYIRKTRDD